MELEFGDDEHYVSLTGVIELADGTPARHKVNERTVSTPRGDVQISTVFYVRPLGMLRFSSVGNLYLTHKGNMFDIMAGASSHYPDTTTPRTCNCYDPFPRAVPHTLN